MSPVLQWSKYITWYILPKLLYGHRLLHGPNAILNYLTHTHDIGPKHIIWPYGPWYQSLYIYIYTYKGSLHVMRCGMLASVHDVRPVLQLVSPCITHLHDLFCRASRLQWMVRNLEWAQNYPEHEKLILSLIGSHPLRLQTDRSRPVSCVESGGLCMYGRNAAD